ncbi:MAG: DUF1837 domain-containing protein [Rhodospirillales bacterium]|nr:DUF1837 domain-containing protein [Rhodospirillales bacterium]
MVHELGAEPGLSGLTADYEDGKWRAARLSEHVTEWLPEFALTWSERESINYVNAASFVRKAANLVYNSDKYQARGEFGELLLHICVRQLFNTIPAVSKLYYKSSIDDTVKGFDAVHVVCAETSLELWLGEAKFYRDISRAITDAVAELKAHTKRNYVREELVLVSNKIDPAWPEAERLKKLIDQNTSLDNIFDCISVPVLLTYESGTLQEHSKWTEECKEQLVQEFWKHYETFSSKDGLPTNVKIHLILMPLDSKDELIEMLDKRLKAWQTI